MGDFSFTPLESRLIDTVILSRNLRVALLQHEVLRSLASVESCQRYAFNVDDMTTAHMLQTEIDVATDKLTDTTVQEIVPGNA